MTVLTDIVLLFLVSSCPCRISEYLGTLGIQKGEIKEAMGLEISWHKEGLTIIIMRSMCSNDMSSIGHILVASSDSPGFTCALDPWPLD